jgi:hypothetical protein
MLGGKYTAEEHLENFYNCVKKLLSVSCCTLVYDERIFREVIQSVLVVI